MNLWTLKIRLAFGVACLTACVAQASVVNGGFESGGLSGWTAVYLTSQQCAGGSCTPDGSVSHAASPTIAMATTGSAYSPISGSASALLVQVSAGPSSPYGGCNVDIWSVGCPQPIPFTSAVQGQLPTYFSGPTLGPRARLQTAIGQDIEILDGQSLRWSWQIFGEATLGASCQYPNLGEGSCYDYAWFYASNGTDSIFLPFRGTSALTDEMVGFSSSGRWSIYFGVNQTTDPEIYSALLLDDVNLVPTPSTLSLALLGLLGLLAVPRVAARKVADVDTVRLSI